MTQWLPIDTYPYDGTWGLFRGYSHYLYDNQIWEFEEDDLPPVCVGTLGKEQIGAREDGYQTISGEPAAVSYIAVHIYGDNPDGYYDRTPLNPTEWLPIRALDMLEDQHITAARLLL